MRKIILTSKFALLCESKLESLMATLRRDTGYGFRLPTPKEVEHLRNKEPQKMSLWFIKSDVIPDFAITTSQVKIMDHALYVKVLYYPSGHIYFARADDTAYNCYMFICPLNKLKGDFTIIE